MRVCLQGVHCALQGGARAGGFNGQGSLAGSASVDSQQQLLAHHQSVATLVPQGGYVPVAVEQVEPGARVDTNAGYAQYYTNSAAGGYSGGGGGMPVSPATNNTDYAQTRRLSMAFGGQQAVASPSATFNVGVNGLPLNASLAARRNASKPDLSSMQFQQQSQFNNLDGAMQQQPAFRYNTLQYSRPATYQAGGGMGYARQQSGGPGLLRPSASMQWGAGAGSQVNTFGLDPGNYSMRASQGNLGGRFGASQPGTPFGTLRRTRCAHVYS